MKNPDKSKLLTDRPVRVIGKYLQCLTHSGKKIVPHDFWIDPYDRILFMGYGEDHRIIIAWQYIRLSIIEPFFFHHVWDFGQCLSLQE